MTPLRKRMMEELQLRNLSPITADTYLRAVERFARHFNQSPHRLGAEQVREYLVHLVQDKKVVGTGQPRSVEVSLRGDPEAEVVR